MMGGGNQNWPQDHPMPEVRSEPIVGAVGSPIGAPVTSKKTLKTLEQLARDCQKRGNRLEIVNGKVYEVARKLLGSLDDYK